MNNRLDLLDGIRGDEVQGRNFPTSLKDSLLKPTIYMSPDLALLYIQCNFTHSILASLNDSASNHIVWPRNHEGFKKLVYHNPQANEDSSLSDPPWQPIDFIPKINIGRPHLGAGESEYELKMKNHEVKRGELPLKLTPIWVSPDQTPSRNISDTSGYADFVRKIEFPQSGHYHKLNPPLK